MLYCKYVKKSLKYLSQNCLNFKFIYHTSTGFHPLVLGFKLLKFFFCLCSAIFGLDLGYFQNFSDISQLKQAFVLWIVLTFKPSIFFYFTQVLLELNFEIFLKFFQTQLTWTGLWNYFEICSTLCNWSWTLKMFWFFFKLILIVIELWKFFELNWTCVHIWLTTCINNCWMIPCMSSD